MKEDPGNLGFVNDLDGGANFYPYYTNRAGDIWRMQKMLSASKRHILLNS